MKNRQSFSHLEAPLSGEPFLFCSDFFKNTIHYPRITNTNLKNDY